MSKKIVIIGGGIVGLATAYQLQKRNPDLQITILEKEAEVSQHQTGHNSGVIHSGIYYKPGSLKANNCRWGYNMLLEFCDEHQIQYDICGKLIVATTTEEIPKLETLYERGRENGLENLILLEKEEIKYVEPHVAGVKAIKVKQTGIIDYKKVSQKLAELIQKSGGNILFGRQVLNISKRKGELVIFTNQGEYIADYGVNCAGLYSDKIFQKDNPGKPKMKIIPFRGEYYKLKEEAKGLVKHLIYPVPDPAFPFLGVHFTRHINGGVEAGPNAVLAFKREGYKKTDFDSSEFLESVAWQGFRKVAMKYWKTGMAEMYRSYSKPAFAKALQKLVPEIKADDLVEGGAGVRAQACMKDGTLIDDFLIEETQQMIHILNAPSPAATSSLSIGNTIADRLIQKMGI